MSAPSILTVRVSPSLAVKMNSPDCSNSEVSLLLAPNNEIVTNPVSQMFTKIQSLIQS